MRYRKLSPSGDYQFGHSAADFWHNEPEAVGQAVQTRLLLYAGEWFLDTSEGTAWGGFPFNQAVVAQARILDVHTQQTRDLTLKLRVLQTQGLAGMVAYSSNFDANSRGFSVNLTIDTIYGALQISGQVPTDQSPTPPITTSISVWDLGASEWDTGSSLWDFKRVTV